MILLTISRGVPARDAKVAACLLRSCGLNLMPPVPQKPVPCSLAAIQVDKTQPISV